MDLERALVPAKLAPERTEMVEAARHEGREPPPGLVLRLVELHRQIDVADLERATRIGAEDPDLANPRQVATLAVRDLIEETLDPPRRLRALHMARLKRGESVPPTHDFPSTTVLASKHELRAIRREGPPAPVAAHVDLAAADGIKRGSVQPDELTPDDPKQRAPSTRSFGARLAVLVFLSNAACPAVGASSSSLAARSACRSPSVPRAPIQPAKASMRIEQTSARTGFIGTSTLLTTLAHSALRAACADKP